MTSANNPGDKPPPTADEAASGAAGAGQALIPGVAQGAGAAAAAGIAAIPGLGGTGAAAAAGAAGALTSAGVAALGALASSGGGGAAAGSAQGVLSPGAAASGAASSAEAGGGWGAAASPGIAGGSAPWPPGGASFTPGIHSVPGAAASAAGAAGGVPGMKPFLPGVGGVNPAAIAQGAAGAIAAAAGAAANPMASLTGAAAAAIGAAAASLPGGIVPGSTPGIPGVPSGLPPGIVPGQDLPEFEDIAVTAGPVQSIVDQALDLLSDAAGAAGDLLGTLGGANLTLKIASGDALDIRNFSIHERLSSLFQVNLIAVSDNPSIDFDAVVGQDARVTVRAGKHVRVWTGICNHIEQVRVEADHQSTYQLSIVPRLWLLTQRRNHHMFQQASEPDIVLEILKEWDIEPDVRIDKGAYKKRKYRVQYAESDFAFISRMLEDAGISYYFEQPDEEEGELKLVLTDAPCSNPKRPGSLSFVDDTSMVKKDANETVTGVRMGQRVRPGKVTLRDHDYRRPPSYSLLKTASAGADPEPRLERFHYVPGAFLFNTDQGESTPVADDRGKTRHDEKEGALLAQKRLEAKRGTARICTFETNAHDLAPGMVISISNHPHEALSGGNTLLIVESSFNGTATGDWSHHCEARSTDVPFRPELVTPRPKVIGVESATVVGPKGEEIHTDEFGRVRVHFHWDRRSKMDENSSCWIHVSQPWAGAGYGGINLPRVGQEVLVDFLSGDPDRPVIIGRVYTNLQKVPYKLPQHKTRSGWKSNSTGQTGGYNEIMFEDAQGKELVNIQAEKDLNQLVKHDETTTTWNNNTNLVGTKHSLTIGKPQEGKQPGTHAPVAGPTNITLTHERIELTTGKASIILEGPNIILRADNDITTSAVMNVSTNALGGNIGLTALIAHINLMGAGGVGVTTPSVVQIDGSKAVLINCVEPKTETVQEEGGGFWGAVGAVALGVGVAAAIISAPVTAGILIGGACAYGMLSR